MQKNASGLKSTWIKNLNIRPNTIQIFEEDIGPNFTTLKLAVILGYDTKGTGNNNKKNQVEIHKSILNVCIKITIHRLKWQPTEWEKIFANHVSDTDLITRMYRKLPQFSNTKAQFKN